MGAGLGTGVGCQLLPREVDCAAYCLCSDSPCVSFQDLLVDQSCQPDFVHRSSLEGVGVGERREYLCSSWPLLSFSLG
eukprot:709734-Amphidinium_carterae.2